LLHKLEKIKKNYERKPLETLKFSLLTVILTASNPQPNSRLRAEKCHYYPTPAHYCGGREGGPGEGWCFSAALAICLIKTLINVHPHYHKKLIENYFLMENLLKQK
jgi:hypothetical protein